MHLRPPSVSKQWRLTLGQGWKGGTYSPIPKSDILRGHDCSVSEIPHCRTSETRSESECTPYEMFPDLLSFPALSRREHHHSTQNLGADRQQECEKDTLRLELLPITRQKSDEPSRSAARQSAQQEGRPR